MQEDSIQKSKQSATRKSKAKRDDTQIAGYPDVQKSSQSTNQISEAEKDNSQIAGYPDIQEFKQPVSQASFKEPLDSLYAGYPNTQISSQQTPQQHEMAFKQPEKLPKHENPDYTQTTFRIPKKLSRQINRALMDLADEDVYEDVYMDRSDLLEELAGTFIRLAEEVGVVQALEKFKNLDTQVSE